MATRVYEGLFLFDSNRYGRDPSGVPESITEIVEKHGGEMLASRLWSEQKLAYPIDGHRKGTYWLTYFRINSDQLGLINRQFQLNEAILRNLIVTVDERLVEALVTHAGGNVEASTPEGEESVTEEEPATADASSE